MMVSERQTNPYLAGMLISVLIAASVAAVAGHGAAEADTNGDQQVNVLDVQTVVAQVLRGTSSDERADVNGDGHIDILDLQRILSQAAQADSSEPELPEKPSPKSTLPSNRVFTPPLLLGYRLPCAFPEGSRRPDPPHCAPRRFRGHSHTGGTIPLRTHPPRAPVGARSADRYCVE